MDIDIKSGTITFRILYAGPEGACKLLNLRGLQQASGEVGTKVSIMHTAGARIASVNVDIGDVGAVLGLKCLFQAIAIPGHADFRATERLLLRATDAVIFLPDRAHPAGRSSRKCFARLLQEIKAQGRDADTVPVVVSDYMDGEPRLNPDAYTSVEQPSALVIPVDGDTSFEATRIFRVARGRILDRFRKIEAEFGLERGRAILSESLGMPDPLQLPAAPTTPWWRREQVVGTILLILAGVAAALVTALV